MDRSVAHVFDARLPTFIVPVQPLCIPALKRHVPPAHRVGPLRYGAVSAPLLMSFEVVSRPICAVFRSNEPECLVPINDSPILALILVQCITTRVISNVIGRCHSSASTNNTQTQLRKSLREPQPQAVALRDGDVLLFVCLFVCRLKLTAAGA